MAFFFNGIFAYYRKSPEIFWRYCKLPVIIYAILLLGVAGSSVLMFQNPDRIVGWIIITCILVASATIYMWVAVIRFGKNFNAEYYQHCLICAKSSELSERDTGISKKGAFLYWLVMTACCIMLSIIVGGLFSLSILGGISNQWNDNYISGTDITEEALIGRWNFVSVESDGEIYSVDSAIEAGASRADAEAMFSQNYFTFYNDGSFELHLYDGSARDVTSGTWALQDSLLIIVDEDNNPDVILLHMDGEYLLIDSETEGIIKLEKVSSNSKTQEDILEPSASGISVSDFIGEYSYDGSFETPDGTWANFYYALSIEDANNGVAITEIWRGIYTFCNDWASQNDLEGNTLYFVVKYGENAGTHSLTYVPAVQSPYGADTIYIDGNTDMPYTRDSYSTDGSYDSDYSYSADEYILPTDTQYITESDLYGMSKERVSLARNEIYARYGYSFQNARIRNYFLQQSWYYENPNINANTFGINNLSDCERANLETIQQYERDMGWK